MERVYREEFTIAWLIVLHVLADVALGVLRTHNAEWLATDFLSAALPRGKIALLAIVVSKAPLARHQGSEHDHSPLRSSEPFLSKPHSGRATGARS